MFNRSRSILMMIALTLGLSAFAAAQDRFGSVEGTVKDSVGAVIPGAAVKIEGNSFSRTVTADAEGYFRVLAVPPGDYTITASASNFSASEPTVATVVLGKATPVDFALQPTGVSATVNVTGDVAGIDPGSSRVQDNLSIERVNQMPKGTNFSSVLSSASSVRKETKGAGFQIDGSSGAENTFIVDGQEVTNFRTGQLNSNNDLPFSLIQEVQIKSGGFEAEHGGATGGVITLVTKRGGNQFNGDFGTSFNTSKLEPRSLFIDNTTPNYSGLSPTENANYLQRSILDQNKDALRYFNPPGDDYTFFFPTATLSGPILKDRLWFFGSYNVQNFDITRNVDYPDGIPSQQYNRTENREYGFIRLDSQIGNKINLNGSFTYNPLTVHGDLPDFTGLASSLPTDGTVSGSDFISTQGGRRASSIYNFGGTYTPSSSWIISSRYGQSYLNEKLGSYGIPTIDRVRCINANEDPNNPGNPYPGTSPSGECFAGFSNVPNILGVDRDISRRTTFDLDANSIFSALGRHNMKFGYQLNRLSNDVATGYSNVGGQGEIRLFYGSSSRGVGENPGDIGYVYIQYFGTNGKTSSKNQALYVQDSWNIGRLTINPGFRIEKEDVPSFSATGIPIVFNWMDKPAPRIGFAYDVFGNGKSRLYGGYGWFYDRFKYELPRGSFGGDVLRRIYVPILGTNPDYTFYTRDYILANQVLDVDLRVPSNDPSDNRVDPNLKAARESSLDIGYEQEVNNEYTFGVRYTHKQIDRTIEDVGVFDENQNELFFIANPGFGITAEPFFPGVPATPKAQRVYDGLEFKVSKRFSHNYFFNASYTYSRLFGNYSGLASSDENGRSSPNVNRFFDIPFLGFTADGRPDNGRLATDRPHVVKLNAGYNFDWRGSKTNTTEFKGFFIGESGTPVSTRVTAYSANTFLFGRGDLGRTDMYTQTDFAISHKYKFGRDNRFTVAVDLDVLNLFNEHAVTNRFATIFSGDLAASSIQQFFPGVTDETSFIQQIFNGGISSTIQELNRRGDAGLSTCGTDGESSCASFATDARFNQPSDFQLPRSVRFGFRFIF